MSDINNVIEQAESSAIAAKSLPTDNTKQAVKDGLEESSSNTKDYYQKRRDGMTDYNTGQMVKLGELPPKPEFYDSSAQHQELSTATADAIVKRLDPLVRNLVTTGDPTGDTVLYRNKPGQTSVPAEQPSEGFLDLLPIDFAGTGPIFGGVEVPRVSRGPNINEAPAEKPSQNINETAPSKDAPHINNGPHKNAQDKEPNIRISSEPQESGNDSPNIKISSGSDAEHGSTGSGQPPMDLKAAYERNAKRIDKDGDGYLSNEEVDAAVHDKSFKGDDARFVAMLKQHGEKIQDLNDDELGPESKGVTFGDIDKLYQLKADNATEQIVRDVDHTLSQSAETMQKTNRDLFAAGDPKESIKPDAIRQGSIGDCYFLAAAASLASKNPEAIQNMIKDNKDGTYTVTFPGDPDNPVTIDAPTDAELAHYTHGNEHGTWPAVLEKAYGKYLGGTQDEADGGAVRAKGVDLLSPNGVDTDLMSTTSQSELDEKLQDTLAKGRPITASTSGKGPLSADYLNDDGLVDGHVYSVVDYDPKTKMVTVRNPWGEGEPMNADGTPKDGKNDGQFQMPLEDFQKKFNRVSYGQG